MVTAARAATVIAIGAVVVAARLVAAATLVDETPPFAAQDLQVRASTFQHCWHAYSVQEGQRANELPDESAMGTRPHNSQFIRLRI